MRNTATIDKPTFDKTDVPCLYRYTGNGVYYALCKHEGKQVRASLKTDDKATAKRKLADFQRDLGKVDAGQGRITLKALCERYLASVASLAPSTLRKRKETVSVLLKDFALGADVQVSKVKTSDLRTWISSYSFGYASYNLYAQILREVFAIAVSDKIIPSSPAAEIKSKKVKVEIRLTPSYEEFCNIISNVRSQPRTSMAKASGDYLEFLGLVGVGQAEASTIQKQHVNLTKKQLTFFRAKTKTPYTVPIFGQVEALVTKLVSSPDMRQTDYLFPIGGSESTITKAKQAKHAFQSACKRLKLPAYTQRSLRRMFITRCIEKGIDVKVIAQWQGHRDGGKLILGTYSHVRNSHAEDMAKLLG